MVRDQRVVRAGIGTGIERQGYSVEEFAFMFGCGRTKVYEMIKAGRIRVVKIGARTIIPKSELDRFLAGAGGGGDV
jgi:excisionase family DNA binding protein